MFFVDKPFVSDFLKQTIKDYHIAVVATDVSKELGLYSETRLISKAGAIVRAQEQKNPIVYMNSENAINWVSEHLVCCDLPEKINLFKDKLKFRNLTQALYPDFTFKGVLVEDLQDVQFAHLPLPFIIKPTVGFFSMGVYKVTSRDEWQNTVDLITAEIEQVKDLYPKEVLDTSTFIIEQCINGEEFALDAYFDADGKPVILSIFKHSFSSDDDVSDRVYTTSKEIIENNLVEFTEFVAKIGQLADVKNFPVHVELRRDTDGVLLPIEVNPMRFGGWCTTADMSFFAFGFNQYHYYHSQLKPNWSELLKNKGGQLFSIIVLDNSTGVAADKITSFNYDKLLSKFTKPLELRKIDYKQYPVFAFLFVQTKASDSTELKYILDSDLREFIST